MGLRVNSVVKLYALLLLNEGARHGYELMKHLSERTGQRIGPSQVYPFLSLLVRKRLLAVESTGAREKKRYALTRKGREAVSALVEKLDGLVASSISSRLTACRNCGCKVYGQGFRKSHSGKVSFYCCASCAENRRCDK